MRVKMMMMIDVKQIIGDLIGQTKFRHVNMCFLSLGKPFVHQQLSWKLRGILVWKFPSKLHPLSGKNLWWDVHQFEMA